MGWIDSHCHLDFPELTGNSDLLSSMDKAGCERVLVPAISAQHFSRVIGFQKSYANKADIALGLHPYFIDQHEERDLERLVSELSMNPIQAIGEIGLDYVMEEKTWSKQKRFFESQLEIASQYKLPVIIHCRKAHDELASLLRTHNVLHGGFIHGFSGSIQQANRYLDLGFKLGLGGALTHERAKAMHRLVRALPDDGYVLETDSPDMRPSFAKDSINTPLNVPKIAEHIAELREQDVHCVFENTSNNYYAVIPHDR